MSFGVDLGYLASSWTTLIPYLRMVCFIFLTEKCEDTIQVFQRKLCNSSITGQKMLVLKYNARSWV